MLSPERVVVPNPELEIVIHGAVVEPTQKEKLVPATEFTASVAAGAVVAIPSLPKRYEVAVVVPIKLPTVSCVPVAMS